MEKHETVLTNLPLGIRFYESFVSTSGYVPFHWHNSIEVLCVLDGRLQLIVNGTSHTLNAGDCIAISSGLVHDVANTPNHAFVLQLPLHILSPFVASPQHLHFNIVKEKHPTAYKAMLNNFHKMNEIIQTKKKGFLFDAELCLIRILKILVIYFTETKPLQGRVSNSIQEMLAYINEHFSESLSVKELAIQAGYNANYLSRLFHEQTGMTLLDYIYRIRLTHFHAKLIKTDTAIKELMLECGLTNERTTREFFQKIYGALPLEIRKRQHT